MRASAGWQRFRNHRSQGDKELIFWFWFATLWFFRMPTQRVSLKIWVWRNPEKNWQPCCRWPIFFFGAYQLWFLSICEPERLCEGNPHPDALCELAAPLFERYPSRSLGSHLRVSAFSSTGRTQSLVETFVFCLTGEVCLPQI